MIMNMFLIIVLLLQGLIGVGDTGIPCTKVLCPNEANSSPSHIIATKGSSVWLHWNYTYIGDGRHGLTTLTYKEQIIGFNSTSQPTVQTLAKRIGQNGALILESPVPPPFNGRVEVISSNSTLVIHNLQYNDSTYSFSSHVKVNGNFGGNNYTYSFKLVPDVLITVNGIADFIKQPPDTLDVNEGSTLQLRIEMDGNPKPSADFRWPHLTGSSPTNVPSDQLYPFVYSSTYTLNNIDASYCGRILETTIKNSIGSSSVRSTNVTVLPQLGRDFGLKARKNGRCIEVNWTKMETGACYVTYEVLLKSASGRHLCSGTGYNIGEMMICNVTTDSIAAVVVLTVSFRNISKTFTREISDTPVSTPVPDTSDSNTGLIVGASVGGVIFLIIIIVIIVFCMKKSKRSRRDTDSGTGYPLQEGKRCSGLSVLAQNRRKSLTMLWQFLMLFSQKEVDREEIVA